MSSRRFTRLSPSAAEVVLLSVTSRVASSRSTEEAEDHSSQAGLVRLFITCTTTSAEIAHSKTM
jgi:hypothetical protein